MLPAEAKRFMPRLLTGLYSYRTAAKKIRLRGNKLPATQEAKKSQEKKQTLELKETEHFAMRRGQKGAQR